MKATTITWTKLLHSHNLSVVSLSVGNETWPGHHFSGCVSDWSKYGWCDNQDCTSFWANGNALLSWHEQWKFLSFSKFHCRTVPCTGLVVCSSGCARWLWKSPGLSRTLRRRCYRPIWNIVEHRRRSPWPERRQATSNQHIYSIVITNVTCLNWIRISPSLSGYGIY